MKVKIRRGFFETNSSSSHGICVDLISDFQVPSAIYFRFNSFGTFFGPYNDLMMNPSYLYTGFYHYNYYWFFTRIIPMLEKNNIQVFYEDVEDISFDHYFDAVWFGSFFDLISKDELLLKQFLFSSRSFLTGGEYGSDDKFYKNLDYERYVYSAAGIG